MSQGDAMKRIGLIILLVLTLASSVLGAVPPIGVLDPLLLAPADTVLRMMSQFPLGATRFGAAGANGGLAWQSAVTVADTFGYSISAANTIASASLPTVLWNISAKNSDDNALCAPNCPTSTHYPCVSANFATYAAKAGARMRTKATWYQFHNEPQTASFWCDTVAKYAQLAVTSHDALITTCPECKFVLAGVTPSYLNQVLDALDAAAGGGLGSGATYYDAVDVHVFGAAQPDPTNPNLDTYDDLATAILNTKTVLANHNSSSKQVWVTETATYSGTPLHHDAGNTPYPTQTERQQARDLVKRFGVSLASGAKVALWAQVANSTNYGGNGPNDFFSNTGLLNVNLSRKLSYYSMKKLCTYLSAMVTDSLTNETTSALHTVTIRMPNATTHRRAWLIWWDSYLDVGESSRTVTVRLTPGATGARVTALVPTPEAGTAVDGTGNFAEQVVAANATTGDVTITIGGDPVWIEEATAGSVAGRVCPER